MWQPEPGWQPLGSGSSSSTVGVWLAGDRVVKRLAAPLPGDPELYRDPRHVGYWRRPAEVALSRVVEDTPGLRSPAALGVEEDAEGITVWLPQVPERPPSGLFVARSLAEFAGHVLPALSWLARDQLRDRLVREAAEAGVLYGAGVLAIRQTCDRAGGGDVLAVGDRHHHRHGGPRRQPGDVAARGVDRKLRLDRLEDPAQIGRLAEAFQIVRTG